MYPRASCYSDKDSLNIDNTCSCLCWSIVMAQHEFVHVASTNVISWVSAHVG